MKRSEVIVAIFIFAICFLAVKFGVVYLRADWEVHNSKRAHWSKEFKKSLLIGCGKTASENYRNVLKNSINDVRALYAVSDYLGEEYCSCVVDSVEAAKVVPTEYNTLQGIDSYNDEAEKAEQQWMESAPGIAAVKTCDKLATSKAKEALMEFELDSEKQNQTASYH